LLVFEKRDDFHQLGLGFVDAGDIGEGHSGVAFDKHPGPGFADIHQTAKALFVRHPAKQEIPEDHNQDKRQ